jgi:predicted nuclease with TOPRIM domain
MTAETENLVLEILKRLQADLASLKSDATEIKVQQSLMGQQLGALTTAFYTGQSRLDKIESRLERIERRLDLVDHPT